MKKPSAEVYSALARLSVDSNFVCVMTWVRDLLLVEDKTNRVQSDPVLLNQGQGRAQAFDHLLTHTKKAVEVVRSQ